MKKELEKLTKQGWIKGSQYGNSDIYTKGEGMILYDSKDDSIIIISDPESNMNHSYSKHNTSLGVEDE